VTSWYIYDGHGNVVGTVNGVTGAFTANPTLDVYGVPRASGTSATKQGYCGSLGHVTDDTGLVYMKARYYDPGCGRFVSQDPGCNGANWYIYCSDNPVTNVDQDGKKASVLDWICFGIGAIIVLAGLTCGVLAIACFIEAAVEGCVELGACGAIFAAMTGAANWESDQIFKALDHNDVGNVEQFLLGACAFMGKSAPIAGVGVVMACMAVEMAECAAELYTD
jgi:RHS repeat-associated protein